jgi:tetratricopeptide (TPR) repeat protein
MTDLRFYRSVGRVHSWVAAALLAWCLAPTARGAELEFPNADDGWIEVQTANFLFFSNAGTGATKRVAEDLEELRAALAQLTDLKLQAPVPTFIYVFKNDRSFTPYKMLYKDEPGVMSGYFLDSEHANYIAIDAGSRNASGIVFHEYVHYVLANNFWWLPVWLSEGLAEFYQTFEVVDDTVYLGLPISSRLATLHGSTLVPLAELLAVDHESPLYNEANRKGDFYAQSWALTHYLVLSDQERRQQLGRYIAAIESGVPPETAFADAFGSNYQMIERDVRTHLRGPRIPFLKSKAEIDVDQSMTIREMSHADVLYRLGDLLSIQIPERPENAAFFERALEVDANHSPSLTALALAAEERAEWEAAGNFYARAVRANPDDAVALFHRGEFLSRQHGDPQSAVATLTRATQLEPSFAPAWAALSHLYVRLGDSSPAALAAAETAHRLAPADDDATLSLLRLYLRLDRREQAERLIETDLQSTPPTQGEAWIALLLNDLLRARELLHEDQALEASARLDAVEADLHFAARPQIIERALADVRTAVSEHNGAKIYDLAFAEYERGEPAAARALLEKALAELPATGPVTATCRHLMDVIDRPEEYAPPQETPVSPTSEEIDRLNRMLAAGDLESAVHYLGQIRDRSTGAQTRWIDGKIRELQSTLAYNRYVDTYNAAVDLYNRKEFARVITMLESLLATLPEGPQAASVRTLMDDARAAISKRSNVQR